MRKIVNKNHILFGDDVERVQYLGRYMRMTITVPEEEQRSSRVMQKGTRPSSEQHH